MTAWGWTVSNNANDWYVVNDTVMGGVSSSSVDTNDSGQMVFSGRLSLENNGGFTSTRTEAIPLLKSGLDTLTFQLRGDGRTYIATIRTPYPSLRRIYYRQSFDTVADQDITVELKGEDFKPYVFGQPVPSAPSLAEIGPAIGSVGIMLADKSPGAFSLQINEISGVSVTGNPSVDDTGDLRGLLTLAIARGVPLFNSGRADACTEIYRAALSTVSLAAYGLNEAQRNDVAKALGAAKSEASASERAWILRRAIDRRLAEAN